jgi:hypothetical protein
VRTRQELATLRPGLLARYDAQLPGARAAVLGRLLGALDREPLPGLSRRPGSGSAATSTGRLHVTGPINDGTPGFSEMSPAARTRMSRMAVFPGLVVRYDGTATPFTPGEAGLSVAIIEPDKAGAGTGGAGTEPWATGAGTAASPARIIDDPGELVRLLWPGSPLAAEIDNSVANLALARAAAHGRAVTLTPGDPDGLALVEQSITDGHPLHPCCRTRGGMSVADVLAYAPEHGPVIRLRRLRVPEDRWYGTAPPVLYAHPWQADRLRDRYPWLGDDGETSPCRPLMSLRTVAPLGGGPHVKTAVDVQMTSAVRTVSPAAVHNGPILSTLLRRITAGLPIDVLAETAAGAVTVDGVPQRHLAFLTREAPVLAPDETVVPLAWLAATPSLPSTLRNPYELISLIGSRLIAPLLTVLDRGVALEAHGQNTLLVLRDGRPHRVLYRDLGGVRVSAARLRAAGLDPPPLHGDLPSDDPRVLRTKLAAAALGTVTAELIAALTRRQGADPHRLWGIVAASIRGTGTADAPHLLRDPLPVKATTAMRLAADPLDDIWAHFDNPMAAHV